MKLADYCDAVNTELVVHRYPNQGERWAAAFKGAEVREGGTLASVYGDGEDALSAIDAYVKKIEGKTLVFGVGTSRRTLTVPTGITL